MEICVSAWEIPIVIALWTIGYELSRLITRGIFNWNKDRKKKGVFKGVKREN